LTQPAAARVVVAAYGHACGVRVLRVLRVLRFDSGLWPLRVVVAAVAAIYSLLPQAEISNISEPS
jgi:hypothetical protein